jgi:hypothetical protein
MTAEEKRDYEQVVVRTFMECPPVVLFDKGAESSEAQSRQTTEAALRISLESAV